jgi:hypothetical protein
MTSLRACAILATASLPSIVTHVRYMFPSSISSSSFYYIRLRSAPVQSQKPGYSYSFAFVNVICFMPFPSFALKQNNLASILREGYRRGITDESQREQFVSHFVHSSGYEDKEEGYLKGFSNSPV